jgi:hypothetical protein
MYVKLEQVNITSLRPDSNPELFPLKNINTNCFKTNCSKKHEQRIMLYNKDVYNFQGSEVREVTSGRF